MMNLEELMRSRRSVRAYRQEAPPDNLLIELIDLACTAPSASNKQPWRFYIIRNRSLIEKLAEEVSHAIDSIGASIQPEYLQQFRQYGDYFTRFKSAPVVIVPVYRPIAVLSNMAGPELAEEYQQNLDKLENNSGIVSTALAIQNLLLAAHERGLGASCMTGPLVANGVLKQQLGIPDGWDTVCFIPLGYADETPEVRKRKPAENVIRWVE